MAGKPVKRMTLTIASVKPGEIRGQRIVEASGRRQALKFDLIEGLFNEEFREDEKIVVEIYEGKPPSKLDNYEFCGHGYVASDPQDSFTILSIWGILFRFEPKINLKINQKYYLCMYRKKG